MAISYNWNVDSMDVAKSDNDKTDVIKSVHWRYIGREDEFVASVYGQVMLDAPSDDFIDFQSVTPDKVMEWTKAKICTGEDEAPTEGTWTSALEAQLQNQKAPAVVSKVPDSWVA